MKKNRPVIKRSNLALFALAVVAATAIAATAVADEGGMKRLEEARLVVEQSSLTKAAKLDVISKADRAVQAGIPAEDVAIIVTRGLGQGVAGADVAGFLAIAVQVKERNLPVRLILDRMEQGLSKGVPAERISGVVQRLVGNLAAARPIVGNVVQSGVKPARSESSDEAIETVARAMEKSIPEDAVMRTGEKVKERKGSIALFDRAVDAMTTFVGSGMSSSQASRLVHAAVDRGYSERDLAAMERYMVDELRKNRPMNDVVSSMESRMEQGEMRGGFDRQGGGMMRGPGPGGMGGGSGMGGRR